MKRNAKLLLSIVIMGSALLSLITFFDPVSAAGTDYVVNSTGDEPDADINNPLCETTLETCTLRAAIQQANQSPDANTIRFRIDNLALDAVITITQSLPAIFTPVTIQGPDILGGGIIINGTDIISDGFVILNSADNTTITEIKISNFGKRGILINGADDVTVSNCVIGEIKLLKTYPGNGTHGIDILSATGAKILNNIISGNGSSSSFGEGIKIYDGESHVIMGNKIGTDSSGSKPLGNSGSGITIFGSDNNTIGGKSEAERNIISGNGGNGIVITSAYVGDTYYESSGNRVIGNYIGTDMTGNTAIPNDGDGITLSKDLYTIIGGSATGEGNLISGNRLAGIRDSGKGLTILGNTIGLNAAKVEAIPNQYGIMAYSPEIALIGGLSPSQLNTIAYNLEDGIYIHFSALMKQIKANAIYSNGGLGINLIADAQEDPSQVTPNDKNDGDNGGNNLQNFPILTSVEYTGTISVTGTLNSTASSLFTLHFYGNDECDPSGFGEGQAYLGTTNVTTNGNHNASFTITLPAPKVYDCISVTAMDSQGNTSEFFSLGKKFVFLPLIIH